jgi:hypothetical protein
VPTAEGLYISLGTKGSEALAVLCSSRKVDSDLLRVFPERPRELHVPTCWTGAYHESHYSASPPCRYFLAIVTNPVGAS